MLRFSQVKFAWGLEEWGVARHIMVVNKGGCEDDECDDDDDDDDDDSW